MKSVLSPSLSSGTIAVGEAFTREGILLRAGALASVFSAISSFDDFCSRCDSLNGSWSITLPATEGERSVYYLAVDHRATRALYYRCVGGNLWIAESGFDLISAEDWATPTGEAEALYFSRWGFTPLNRTLHPEVMRLRAGYALRFCPGEAIQMRAYTGAWRPIPEALTLSYEEALEQMQSLMDGAMDRMVQAIGERTIILPLTGGRDSRLIATALVERGLGSRVYACTYGHHDATDEVRQAREVAARLGLKHETVCTIPEGYTSLGYTQDAEALHYLGYISGLGSGYFFGEYTTSRLVAQRDLGECIALPGHAGDILGGAHLQHQPQEGAKAEARNLRKLLYFEGANRRLSRSDEARLVAMMREQFATYPEHLSQAQRFEYFRTLELSSKYYINSARGWRYWGHAVWMPYLDRPLADFVYSLPPAYRYGKRIYEDLTNRTFARHGVSLPSDKSEFALSQSPVFRLKQCLRPYIGRYLSDRRKPFDSADDMGFARLMGGELLRQVRQHSPIEPNTANGLSFAWWLYAIRACAQALIKQQG